MSIWLAGCRRRHGCCYGPPACSSTSSYHCLTLSYCAGNYFIVFSLIVAVFRTRFINQSILFVSVAYSNKQPLQGPQRGGTVNRYKTGVGRNNAQIPLLYPNPTQPDPTGFPTSFKRASSWIDGFPTSSQLFRVENLALSRIALSRHVEIDRAGLKQVRCASDQLDRWNIKTTRPNQTQPACAYLGLV